MQEPTPYKPPEQVVAEWIAFYEWENPDQEPPVKWLSHKTRLGKSCVAAYRGRFYARRRADNSTARKSAPQTP